MKRAAGFTLLELLVVLAIIALISAIALPNLKIPTFGSRAAHVARQISSGLAETRQIAVHMNRESVFVVDVADHSYQIGTKKTVNLPGIEAITLLTAERDVINEVRGLIRFYPDGSSNGGEIAVKDASGAAVTVRVNWLTGMITHDG